MHCVAGFQIIEFLQTFSKFPPLYKPYSSTFVCFNILKTYFKGKYPLSPLSPNKSSSVGGWPIGGGPKKGGPF